MTEHDLCPICGSDHADDVWSEPPPGYPVRREHTPDSVTPVEGAWALAGWLAGLVPAIDKMTGRQEYLGVATDALAAAWMVLRHADHDCPYEDHHGEWSA